MHSAIFKGFTKNEARLLIFLMIIPHCYLSLSLKQFMERTQDTNS